MYDRAADKIYWHSCCVEISISVYQHNFPVLVMDEKRRFVSLQAVVRKIRPSPKPALEQPRKGGGTCFRANEVPPLQ